MKESLLKRLKTAKPNYVTLEDAVALCTKVEHHIRYLGCHVALTGGTLYKGGPRKDIDILIYRVRQIEHPPQEKIMKALGKAGLVETSRYNWVVKCDYTPTGREEPINVDVFFPELFPEISELNDEY